MHMGKYRISRKAWRTASDVLLYYPDNKKEYASLLDAVLTAGYEEEGNSNGLGGDTSDPTARAAIRLAGNKRAERLKQEIEAVDNAVSSLRTAEVKVIRRRFWHRTKKNETRKPLPYDFMQDLPFSDRQMHRIVQGTIIRIAQFLGEI